MTPSTIQLTSTPHRPNVNTVLITPLQLEKEPLLFDEAIPAGTLEYAPDISQIGPMPVTGRADLILEHRGHTRKSPTSACARPTKATSSPLRPVR